MSATGLAAGVGSGDQDAAGVGGERGGDGDDLAGEQWMAGGVEDEIGRFEAEPVEVVAFGGERGVELGGQPSLGLGQIDLGEAADGGADGAGFLAD